MFVDMFGAGSKRGCICSLLPNHIHACHRRHDRDPNRKWIRVFNGSICHTPWSIMYMACSRFGSLLPIRLLLFLPAVVRVRGAAALHVYLTPTSKLTLFLPAQQISGLRTPWVDLNVRIWRTGKLLMTFLGCHTYEWGSVAVYCSLFALCRATVANITSLSIYLS